MKKKVYNILLVFGLVLAIIFGIYLPNIMEKLAFLGDIYLNLLKFMIAPIIFSSIICSIYHSSKIKNHFIIKTIFLFITMFIASFFLTSIVILISNIGHNYSYEFSSWTGEVVGLELSSIITNLFPSNLVTIFQNNSLFSIIFLAILCGYAAIKVENGDKVIDFFDGLKNIFYKILEYIMYLTPLGVFSLLGNAIVKYGTTLFSLGAKYIGAAYFCSFLVLIFIMILPAYFIGNVNPFSYIKKVLKVWMISLTTCSSVATLPTTIKTCEEDFNIPSNITNITVPLGCTIHMCGGAVSFALLGIFCCQLFNIDITFSKYLLMLFSATVINMAAPGIPGGGIIIGASYLTILGVPLSFIGFYSSIYKILDMAYTTLNVTGDITANIIIHKITSLKKRKRKLQ